MAISVTHARAAQGQRQHITVIKWKLVTRTAIDLIRKDHKIIGKAFCIRNGIPIRLERDARNAECDACVGSYKEVNKKHQVDQSLLPFLVGWKQS